jgi:hypothetical protein
MRFRLRTLLIVLAVGPALLAGAWLTGVEVAENENLQRALFGVFMVVSPLLCYAIFAIGLGLTTARIVNTTIDWFIRQNQR